MTDETQTPGASTEKENVLALMRRENKKSITELRKRIETAKETNSVEDESCGVRPGKCITIPVLEAQAEMSQRTNENQEFIIERLIKNGNSKPAPATKCLKLWGIEFKGFEIRDAIRFVFAIAVILILFHIFGMKSEVRGLKERLLNEPSKTEEVSP